MSEKIEDGGPAFPIVGGGVDSRLFEDYGMSLRDYFAAHSLAGVISSVSNGTHTAPEGMSHIEWIAKSAYYLADAMLAERVKVKP